MKSTDELWEHGVPVMSGIQINFNSVLLNRKELHSPKQLSLSHKGLERAEEEARVSGCRMALTLRWLLAHAITGSGHL